MNLHPITHILNALLSICLLVGCSVEPIPGDDNEKQDQEQDKDQDQGPEQDTGLAYVFDFDYIPEIHITIPLDEWNMMLTEFDKNPDTSEYFKCYVRYVKGEEEKNIREAGFRLKGNTSRRRPEGSAGQMHDSVNPDWHHCHFQLNFTKFHKGDAQEIHGVKKL